MLLAELDWKLTRFLTEYNLILNLNCCNLYSETYALFGHPMMESPDRFVRPPRESKSGRQARPSSPKATGNEEPDGRPVPERFITAYASGYVLFSPEPRKDWPMISLKRIILQKTVQNEELK